MQGWIAAVVDDAQTRFPRSELALPAGRPNNGQDSLSKFRGITVKRPRRDGLVLTSCRRTGGEDDEIPNQLILDGSV